MIFSRFIVAVALLPLALLGCSERARQARAGEGGILAIDGSSTVYPFAEALAEELGKRSATRVTIGISGTGGGFKKLCAGEIAIAAASRPIKATEAEACRAAGVEVIELPIAYDGVAIAVHPSNTWATSITVAELKKLWAPEAQGKIMRWSDVRADWPQEEVHLFGAGVDSGTYDYFTQAIVGKEHASRGDFTSSEDDNVLVQGVATDRVALGFFGLAYFHDNAAKLKLVPVDDQNDDNGAGPVGASVSTVRDGTYQPLARPLFLYVSRADADRPEVQAFVHASLKEGRQLAQDVGYVSLPPEAYALVEKRFDERVTGSAFAGSKVGMTITELLGSGG